MIKIANYKGYTKVGIIFESSSKAEDYANTTLNLQSGYIIDSPAGTDAILYIKN